MPHYPILKTNEVIKALEKAGFYFVHQKGSHARYSNGNLKTTVPMNKKDIDDLTLKSILKQIKTELEDFMKLL